MQTFRDMEDNVLVNLGALKSLAQEANPSELSLYSGLTVFRETVVVLFSFTNFDASHIMRELVDDVLFVMDIRVKTGNGLGALVSCR